MEALQPEQALYFFKNISLPALRNEQATTKRVIEAIPTGKGNYRPDPCAKSALELAWHITSAEHLFLNAIATGAFEFSPNPRPENVNDGPSIAAIYAKNCEQDLANLSKLTGEQLAKFLDFRGIFQLPAAMYAQFNLAHIIHHRGQLSTYLRPMGAKVPAIYGESYDSAEAKKTAQAAN